MINLRSTVLASHSGLKGTVAANQVFNRYNYFFLLILLKINNKMQITFEFSPYSGSDFTVGVFLLLIGGDSRSVLIDLLEITLGELL